MATQSRGRTSIPKPISSKATNRTSPIEQKTQTSRAVSPGAGIRRGDRRDTHPSYSTGKAGRGSSAGPQRDGGRAGPKGASTRKSGPSALKPTVGAKAKDVARAKAKKK